MEINNNRDSSAQSTRQVTEPRPRRNAEPREQPKAEQVDRFRGLMHAKGDGDWKADQKKGLLTGAHARTGDAHATAAEHSQTLTQTAVSGNDGQHDDQQGFHGKDQETLKPAELAALYQAQLVAREAPLAVPASAPVPQANPQVLADMLERHVRQLAVRDGSDGGDSAVLLRLNDSSLPGTDLTLIKTEGGWLLKADVTNVDSLDAIRNAAPGLAKRFSARSLGELTVEPSLRG